MSRNNNMSVIPFYESLEEQDFRKWYSYGKVFPLVVSQNSLTPFFFVMPSTASLITNIEVYKLCCDNKSFIQEGDYNLDFSEDFKIYKNADETYWENKFTDAGMFVATAGEYKIVVFGPARNSLGFDLGRFYLKFTLDDGSVRYSEVFTCVSDAELSRYLRIEWKNIVSLEYEDGVIPYSFGLTNILYLDSDIGMPEYEFEEEGEERDGYFFAVKQVSWKLYKFVAVCPEYVCDVMRLIRLSDYISLTDPLGREYSATSFLMDVNWLDQGHYASIDCEFTTNTVVKAIGGTI